LNVSRHTCRDRLSLVLDRSFFPSLTHILIYGANACAYNCPKAADHCKEDRSPFPALRTSTCSVKRRRSCPRCMQEGIQTCQSSRRPHTHSLAHLCNRRRLVLSCRLRLRLDVACYRDALHLHPRVSRHSFRDMARNPHSYHTLDS
jgi:hypothetical protein